MIHGVKGEYVCCPKALDSVFAAGLARADRSDGWLADWFVNLLSQALLVFPRLSSESCVQEILLPQSLE